MKRLNFVTLVGLLILLYGGTQIINTPAPSPSQQDTIKFNPQYYLLKKTLEQYDLISANGGWDSIPWVKGPLQPVKIFPVISLLRKRLITEGYLPQKTISHPDSFDTELKIALQTFQKNNGLEPLGNLNQSTILALNIPAEKRIEQLKINIERWKTLPENLGKQYLFVNAADFSLSVYESDSLVMKMKIIIGRTYRKTPIFSAKLTHIIFNPTWTIPPTILIKDILPLVRKDPSYLGRKNIHVYKKEKGGIRSEISPASVNWSQFSERNIPYDLVQDPGPENALGVVKFIFPNSYNVYMHDTPSKELFKELEPTFSSGCIRLSRAVSLANYLLKKEKGWTPKKIKETIQSDETKTVLLHPPVNVYIEYFTAWIDVNGAVQFRKDIYNRDIATHSYFQ